MHLLNLARRPSSCLAVSLIELICCRRERLAALGQPVEWRWRAVGDERTFTSFLLSAFACLEQARARLVSDRLSFTACVLRHTRTRTRTLLQARFGRNARPPGRHSTARGGWTADRRRPSPFFAYMATLRPACPRRKQHYTRCVRGTFSQQLLPEFCGTQIRRANWSTAIKISTERFHALLGRESTPCKLESYASCKRLRIDETAGQSTIAARLIEIGRSSAGV